MKVYIAQLLCPQRHTILALAGEYESLEAATAQLSEWLEAAKQKLLESRNLDPWCGLCKSRDWHIEVGTTPFRSMEEARPALKQAERDQQATATYLKSTRS